MTPAPLPLPWMNGGSPATPSSTIPQSGAQAPLAMAPTFMPKPYSPHAAPPGTVVPLKSPSIPYYSPATPDGATTNGLGAGPAPVNGSPWPAQLTGTTAFQAAAPPAVHVPIPATTASSFVDVETFIENCAADPTAWSWEGLLPETGIAMVAGPPFSGKSVLMAAFAACTSLGHPLAGRCVAPGTVLYVKLEHRDADFKTLFQANKKALGGAHLGGNLFVTTKLNLDDLDALDAFEQEAAHVGVDVIIIDSLRRASQMDENKSQETAEVMARLQRLTAGGSRLVVVLHHVTKSTSTPRGSTDLLAGVDSFLLLTRNDNRVTIHATHHGGAEAEVTMKMSFENESLSITEVDQPAQASNASNGEKVKAVILDLCAKKEMTKSGLREAVRKTMQTLYKLGVGQEAIDAHVEELADAGRLQNLGGKTKSRWVTVQPPVAAAPLVPGGGFLSTPPLPSK